ncbi:MAG TPA: DUF1611 domain-containing protein [Fimbriimonadaceae bacterium]|jgi:uncharacterized NAD-dependent epimerase/dehydratase family protein
MLERSQKLAIYVEGELAGPSAKMGSGILRYSPNEVAAVIDSTFAGQDVREVIDSPRSVPVVATIAEAKALGADVFVLGVAPPGGHIPEEWFSAIDEAIGLGMSLVNGLHDQLNPRYPNLKPGQWIWDIRIEPEGLGTANGDSARLKNKRLLLIGTDMAIGKMTAGLEIYRGARDKGVRTEFIATGQIGITIMGKGIPLDAVRVDYAGGAVEREVLSVAYADLVIVEGQGALLHPGSTANLPLLRGTCPTHLILCHRAGQEHLLRLPDIKIPPLRDYIKLYEDLGEVCGTFPRPATVAVALNTAGLSADEAKAEIDAVSKESGLPTADPIRDGVEVFLQALGI